MSRYNPDIHHRRSIRLRGYDYSQAGAYFVTVCAHNRESLFGEIVDGAMGMNHFGELVENAWNDLPTHYPWVVLDRFIVMPNHVHGIIVFDGNVNAVGAGFKPAPTESASIVKRHGLPEIVRAFKTFSARRINETRNSTGVPVWQRNYYEHVIRDDADYSRIAEYVVTNPKRWIEDTLNPVNIKAGVGAGLKPAPTGHVPQPGGRDE